MEAFLLRHGYPLLFAGVFVEGEAFLLAASFLAREGRLFLPAVILAVNRFKSLRRPSVRQRRQ